MDKIKTRYILKCNNLYYLKENAINGRIFNASTIDRDILPYLILECGYKTKEGAKKAAKKLLKENKPYNVTIQGLTFENY